MDSSSSQIESDLRIESNKSGEFEFPSSSVPKIGQWLQDDPETQELSVSTSSSIQTLNPFKKQIQHFLQQISKNSLLQTSHHLGNVTLRTDGFDQPIYLRIPLEIYLNVSWESVMSKPLKVVSVNLPSCSTQTSKVKIFENGFMPQCWSCIRKPHTLRLESKELLEPRSLKAIHQIWTSSSSEYLVSDIFDGKASSTPSSELSSQQLEDDVFGDKQSTTPSSKLRSKQLENHERDDKLSTDDTDSSLVDSLPKVDIFDDSLTRDDKEDKDIPEVSIHTQGVHKIKYICNCEKAEPSGHDRSKYESNAEQCPLLCENQHKCDCYSEDMKGVPRVSSKLFVQALPQHKDLRLCVNCRFEPSPLVDEDGHVFCPGNCGCCLCPWQPRAAPSLEDILSHSKLKVCECSKRISIFGETTSNTSRCCQTSYFDICPCRERAEAKHLELYDCEMGGKETELKKQILLQKVSLNNVKEKPKKH